MIKSRQNKFDNPKKGLVIEGQLSVCHSQNRKRTPNNTQLDSEVANWSQGGAYFFFLQEVFHVLAIITPIYRKFDSVVSQVPLRLCTRYGSNRPLGGAFFIKRTLVYCKVLQ